MKIFAMRDGGGCGYYRVTMPMKALASNGHDVTFGELEGKGVEPDAPKGYPYIVGQRIDNYEAVKFWRRLRLPGSALVYELDDDVWNVERTNWQAYGIYSRSDVQDAVQHGLEVADMVTCTTEPLAEILRKFNSNVKVLPNHIPSWACDLPNTRQMYGGPTVGWMGGASHALDISEAVTHVRRFLDRYPAWTCHFIGTDYRATLKHSHAKHTPWVRIAKDDRTFYKVIDFDIGIAPLALTTFNRSKSHIKALEYGARGIPCIATDSEPYHDFIKHGETGFLVRRDHEWLKYLSLLAEDADLRKSMGEKAREQARAWTIDEHWVKWANAYGELK